MRTGLSKAQPDEMRAALAACRPGLLAVALTTGVLALLPVAAAIFVLMLFDVVLIGRSGATLAGLSGLIIVVLAMQTWLSLIRERTLAQVAVAIHQRLSGRLDGAIARSIETAPTPGDGLQPARDLDSVRALLLGHGAAAMCDIAAVPLLLLVMVLFHGLLALTLLVIAAAMALLLWRTLATTVERARARSAALSERNVATETGLRHTELIRVLGMHVRAAFARSVSERRLVALELADADADAWRATLARALRLGGVAAVLVVGVWLGIGGRASGGVIAAAALLADRALRPLEIAVAGAASVAAARLGWDRVGAVLARIPPEDAPLPLPAPAATLSVEALGLTVPGTRRIVLRDVSFALSAGDMLTVAGGSAVGKSALLRAIVGGWRPAAGQVRVDGAALDQWDALQLGRSIGYMPQLPELFDGTVAQNIARFDPDATADAVIAAATAAGVHDWIVRLPQGYESEIGAGGNRLSGGERQRIALARALFGDPFVLALDEPAAYADAQTLPALAAAMRAARERGAIVIVTGSAPATLNASNLLLVLRAGQVQDYGPRDDVRARLAGPRTAVRAEPPTVAEVSS